MSLFLVQKKTKNQIQLYHHLLIQMIILLITLKEITFRKTKKEILQKTTTSQYQTMN